MGLTSGGSRDPGKHSQISPGHVNGCFFQFILSRVMPLSIAILLDTLLTRQREGGTKFLEHAMHLIKCNQGTFMSTWGHKFYSYLLQPAGSLCIPCIDLLNTLWWTFTYLNSFNIQYFYSYHHQLATVAAEVKLNIEILLTQNINLYGVHWSELKCFDILI